MLKIEKDLDLPPLDRRGYPGSIRKARLWRADVLKSFERPYHYGISDLPSDPLVRRTLLWAACEKAIWLTKARYWKPWRYRPRNSTVQAVTATEDVLRYLLRSSKPLWFAYALVDPDFRWVAYLRPVESTAGAHDFTREELLPLVAHKDAEIRNLGFKLMGRVR